MGFIGVPLPGFPFGFVQAQHGDPGDDPRQEEQRVQWPCRAEATAAAGCA
jgi:hypothetical protein